MNRFKTHDLNLKTTTKFVDVLLEVEGEKVFAKVRHRTRMELSDRKNTRHAFSRELREERVYA